MKPARIASILLRVAITAGAIIWAFSRVPLSDVVPLLRGVNPWPMLLAVLLVHLSQLISAMRTRYYLATDAIHMPLKASLALHYVGGLFNALLPGGTGGDVYKTWWLKKYHHGTLLNLARLIVAGRLNGLWALGVISCGLGMFSASARTLVPDAPWLLLGVIILGSVAYYGLARFALKDPLARQLRGGAYSLALQSLAMLAAFAVCHALAIADYPLEYVALFLLSCVVAMLPISIGGIGVREIVLLHGSTWLGLSPEHGVALALSFSLLNLTIPLIGAAVYARWRPVMQEATA